ncbi:molybdopterin molybdotransferase [Kribbella amoyensis]|uniref:Molybdopterin molybdenumtransferase n=1 Tax=Kribbella amoyensis TaxID=996641 RepID=A0A561BR38_9ACTN|nr:molybdopterin molybdotransferase MoeA [Kribbella amoyensis]TWD81347.1 molybdopterin molybdotransferase [Kribbella amoyensis]
MQPPDLDRQRPSLHQSSLPWDVARELAHAVATPLRPRSVVLAEADGTTLAVPLVASAAVPPVDRSAMDGYAVRGPGPWRLVGTIRAGSGLAPELEDGQAYKIVTGAAVPTGTTAVLPDEEAIRSEDDVAGSAIPGRHIRRAGEECAAGEVLLPAGVVVDPSVLGLAATLGLNRLTVLPRPRVAAFVTGDELVHAGASGPGRVRDAIGPMVPGLVHRAGGCSSPAEVRHLEDSRQALVDALASADAELILVSGSSASGPADHLRSALAELGAELIVDGVACRPGHPQALARFEDGRLVLGLPGNPLAALTAFLTLGVAALRRLRGLGLPPLPICSVPGGLQSHPHSTRLVPVRVTAEGAVPVGHGGSAMLRGAAAADAFAVVPPGPSTAVAVRLLALDPGAGPWVG